MESFEEIIYFRMDSKLESLVARLERAVAKLEGNCLIMVHDVFGISYSIKFVFRFSE